MTDELDRRTQPVLQRFDEQLHKQQALADSYRFLSRAVLTQSALYGRAGTDTSRYEHFPRLSAEYRMRRTYLNPANAAGRKDDARSPHRSDPDVPIWRGAGASCSDA